jgi:hypothetical protein
MDNQKQLIINKRFQLNQEIKKHRNLLKTDKNNELLHLRAINDLKEERQTVNFLINKFNYIYNFFNNN